MVDYEDVFMFGGTDSVEPTLPGQARIAHEIYDDRPGTIQMILCISMTCGRTTSRRESGHISSPSA